MADARGGAVDAGGLETVLDPNIHEAIWSKAIFNAAMNPLCALTRRTPVSSARTRKVARHDPCRGRPKALPQRTPMA